MSAISGVSVFVNAVGVRSTDGTIWLQMGMSGQHIAIPIFGLW